LDFLGIPWILSTEMSLFNGLRAKPREFYLSCGPFPGERLRPVRDGGSACASSDVRMKGSYWVFCFSARKSRHSPFMRAERPDSLGLQLLSRMKKSIIRPAIAE